MSRRLLRTLGLLTLVSWPIGAIAGEFDRLEGGELQKLTKDEGSKRAERLSFDDIERLPAALPDARSAFLVVKTGEGRYARILASPAFRKTPGALSGGEMPKRDGGAMAKKGANSLGGAGVLPVLVVERFDTFEVGKGGSRVARGAGLILFNGFQLDLDAGQVVPPGQGGDLEFRAEGNASPVLKTLGDAVLFTLSKPIAPKAAGTSGPSPGKAVLPTDFDGRYRLQADGRWSGLLELKVAADRQVTGQFRSEANGTSYPISGTLPAESPQKAEFRIEFPRTEQEYSAFLWTEGENVLSGTFTMTGRTFGFVAVREGASLPTESPAR